MTREEYREWIIRMNDYTEEYFDEFYIVLPCNCGYSGCKGWEAVVNDSLAIKVHNERNNGY